MMLLSQGTCLWWMNQLVAGGILQKARCSRRSFCCIKCVMFIYIYIYMLASGFYFNDVLSVTCKGSCRQGVLWRREHSQSSLL